MAKKSAVERDKKRARMAQKYAGRRARLKAAAVDQSLPAEDRFAARLKLAEMPRNSVNVTGACSAVVRGVITVNLKCHASRCAN